MTLPTTLHAILEALRNAGATEEMLAAAIRAPHGAKRARATVAWSTQWGYVGRADDMTPHRASYDPRSAQK
jgi:hypothetical protein